MKMCIIIISLILLISAACFAQNNISINSGQLSSDILKKAESELANYLDLIYNQSVYITDDQTADFIIGTNISNPVIAKAVKDGSINLPKGKNDDQGYTIKNIDKHIYITARTDIGVLYGVYTFLESQGVYFLPTGERLPDKKNWKAPQINIFQSPVFKYRGVLPWDNFLCGMSGYNYEDFVLLYDRLTRMKFNMVQYHFYAGMAYFTETVDGKTANPSYVGMPVDIFKTKNAVAQSVFGNTEIFGVKDYIDNMGDPRAQAVSVQKMFRKSLDYAKSLGWKTVIGYEVCYSPVGDFIYTNKPATNGLGQNLIDPSIESNIDKSVDRFKSLKAMYPNSDYYWFWNNEARGVLGRNTGNEPGAVEIREKYAHWSTFKDFDGDIDYAYLVYRILNKLTPKERENIATGGWSINHLFNGMNEDFPKETIFATLNNPDPQFTLNNQMDSFGAARTGRPTWIIDWWEFDGNQWFPQFRNTWQEKFYKKCASDGVEAVTLLGWKLSGVEHGIKYLADFSWNPKLSAKDFYKNYNSKLYGNAAKSLVDNFMEYDQSAPKEPGANPGDARYMLLGAGWMPLAIPDFPGIKEGLETDSWKNTVKLASGDVCGISGLTRLKSLDENTVAEINNILPKLDEVGRDWLSLMKNRLEFRIIYCDSMIAVNNALIAYDRIGREKTIKDAQSEAGMFTAIALEKSKDAIEKYAEDIRNTNDIGVIAQLNKQYYEPLKALNNTMSNVKSKYYDIDWDAFRINANKSFDFTGDNNAWHLRDGDIKFEKITSEGVPALRLTIGSNVNFNSAVIPVGNLDLNESPYMDFMIKTDDTTLFGMMFQIAGSSEWHCINFYGKQNMYHSIETIKNITPNKWHRVTINLKELVDENLNTNELVITSLIIGNWEVISNPFSLEFKNFSFGKRNMLN